jgi:Fe-S oxidoreductase
LLAQIYSPDLLAAFAEFKHALDPEGLLNPGILVAPKAFADDLRAPTVVALGSRPPTLALAADGGDFGRAARRCVGVGKCRSASGGVMCPSYRATGDEKDSTRGRARVLQEMLDGRTITSGYRSEEVLDALDLCLGCKGCRTDCPVGVDMAAYKTEFLHKHYRGRLRPPAHYSLGWLPLWARLAGLAPGLVNRVLASPAGVVAKRLGGIAAERELPVFARRSFSKRAGAGRRVSPADAGERPAVVLWADTFTESFTPEVGTAMVKVLRSAGFRVLLPPRRGCCGLTWISTGQLDVARRVLSHTLRTLQPALEAGLPIVVPEPSCAAALRTDLLELLPDHPLAHRAAAQITGLSDFLTKQAPNWRPPAPNPLAGRKALVQIHCHQYATGGQGTAERDLLARAGIDAEILDTGCCGLAGDFGVVTGHYEVSLAVAELGLLPAVRAAAADTLIVADGFSCRTQILQGVPGRRVVHLAEVLAAGL